MRPRVILKKTSYLKKQVRGNSKRISTYLEKYVDEVGKALTKRGEAPWVNTEGSGKTANSEPRWLLPKERTGVFYTGGFLGNQESPGNDQPNKQKGWIKRFTSNWIKALEINSQRRNDGFRFILGLSPETVKELTAANISCDQAMREIWTTTVELYRERHGWSSPENDVAWLAGAHHDTDNAHMHIMLFPTTKSGKLLRTNNNRGKERINDLNDLISMVNISAELYYREIMPFKAQSDEFKRALLSSPEEEPPIPTLEDFNIPSGLAGEKRKRISSREKEQEDDGLSRTISWEDISPLDKKRKEEMALEYGESSIIEKIKNKINALKAKMILGAIATVIKVWENKKIKFFPTIRELHEKKDIQRTLEKVGEAFPEENKELEQLRNVIDAGIIRRERTLKRLVAILNNGHERSQALINMSIGLRKNIKSIDAYKMSLNLIGAYESNVLPKDNQKKLSLIEAEGKNCLLEKKLENKRTIEYLSIKRSIKSFLKSQKQGIPRGKKDRDLEIASDAIGILDQMIEGSKKVALSLEGRYLEASYSVEKDAQGLRVRQEDREWKVNKTTAGYELIVKPSIGKPYPPHLDPETVIEELRKEKDTEISNQAISRTSIEKTKSLTSPASEIKRGVVLGDTGSDQSNPLEIIIYTKNLKDRERKNQVRKRLREIRQSDNSSMGAEEEREIK